MAATLRPSDTYHDASRIAEIRRNYGFETDLQRL